jgi:putative hemolysin
VGNASILELGVGLTAIGRAYARAAAGDATVDFAARALGALNVTPALTNVDLLKISAEGPLVVVANHPFGGLDGLLLLALIGRVRRDIKILGNHLLARLPELHDRLLLVDPFGSPSAVGRNSVAFAQRCGGSVEEDVSQCFRREVAYACRDGRVRRFRWHVAAAWLAVRAGAPVLPVHFEGGNSRPFSLAGRIHPLLRTALLPRELWAKRGSTVAVSIGEPIAFQALAGIVGPAARTSFLRSQVDALAASNGRRVYRPGPARGTLSVQNPGPAQRTRGLPIAARGSAAALDADIDALGSSVLLESGAYQVFCASAEPSSGATRNQRTGDGVSQRRRGGVRAIRPSSETYQHRLCGIGNAGSRRCVSARRDEIWSWRGRRRLYPHSVRYVRH